MDTGVFLAGVGVLLFLFTSAVSAILGETGFAALLLLFDVGPAALFGSLWDDRRKAYGLARDVLDNQRLIDMGTDFALNILLMICLIFILILSPEPSPPIPLQISLGTTGAIVLITSSFVVYLKGRQLYFRNVVHITLGKRRRGVRSRVKRRDVKKMATEGDTESLARVLTSDPNFRNRLIAAEALGNQSSQASSNALNAGLEDEEPEVRLVCAISLARQGDQRGKELVETLFAEGSDWDRVFIVTSLASLDQAWVTRLVQAARQHSSGAVRKAAESAISHENISD